MSQTSTVTAVFRRCFEAITKQILIQRASRQDKEFHFQNWVQQRLVETIPHFELPGRNIYPDFRVVDIAEGYEVKGLAYPGRHADYDANSQLPSGEHNGRTIFYIFGRYPKEPDGNAYPVLDLVVCHGDFLNASRNYVHSNKSIKGFGSYGDILIRDRKMYVAPTPFGIAAGLAHNYTLILPEGFPGTDVFKHVGTLIRKETDKLLTSYVFDLRMNALTFTTIPNPTAGAAHTFHAWRVNTSSDEPVTLRKDEEQQGSAAIDETTDQSEDDDA